MCYNTFKISDQLGGDLVHLFIHPSWAYYHVKAPHEFQMSKMNAHKGVKKMNTKTWK